VKLDFSLSKSRPQGDHLITPLIDSARQELSVDGHIVFGPKIGPAAPFLNGDFSGPIGNFNLFCRELTGKFSSTGRFGGS
jgi:hypothetical protein